MLTTEERVDRLEDVFSRFMVRTETAIERMDRQLAEFKAQAEKDRQQAEKDRAEAQRRTEIARQQAEKDRAEAQRRTEIARQQAEKDRQEARERAEKDRQEALEREERDRQEFRERMEKYDQQAEKDREEARRERRELARQLGDISNRLGTVVEDIIAPSLRRLAREEFGCGDEITFAMRIVQTRPDGSGRRREFEGLYVGADAILLNESKATVRPEYASAFADFLRSGEFFEYFPQYLGRPIVPVFSSLYIPDDTVTYLTRQGIYAVGMGDEAMQVLNRDEVAARRAQ